MSDKQNIIKYILTVIWGIAGIFNTVMAVKGYKKESAYIKQLLQENKELKEKIIQLNANESYREGQRMA